MVILVADLVRAAEKCGAGEDGHGLLHGGTVFADGFGVFRNEMLAHADFLREVVEVKRKRGETREEEGLRADGADLIGDVLVQALDDGGDADDAGDSDDHAQHGEKRAGLLARQCGERHAEALFPFRAGHHRK